MASQTPDSLGGATYRSTALDTTPGTMSSSRAQTAELRALIATKERELHDATEFRLNALENLLTERVRGSTVGMCEAAATAPLHNLQDTELDELKDKFRRLRTDFLYNVEVRLCFKVALSKARCGI